MSPPSSPPPTSGDDGSERPRDHDLEALLRAAAAGDERAWFDLIKAWAPRVRGLIYAQCGDVDLAEEIAQSTFVTVAEKLAGYAEMGRFESWIFRIATNRMRDEMRRRKRHAVSVDDSTLAGLAADSGGRMPSRLGPGAGEDPSGSGSGGSDDFLSGLRDDEKRHLLETAMKHLSDPQKQVLYMRHAANLSFKQIADIFKEPLGTVLARHHRALGKLRDVLPESLGADDVDETEDGHGKKDGSA